VQYYYVQEAKSHPGDSCVFEISYCASEDPPIRPGTEVKKLCSVSCDWGNPFSEWMPIGDPKKGWRRATGLSVSMKCEGQLKWTVRAGAGAGERDIDPDYAP